MNSKNLSTVIGISVGIIVGIYAVFSILLNPTGGIAGLSKLLTVVGVLFGLMNPKKALIYLAFQVIYSDEMKRIGVFYGLESSKTISEILIGPLLTLCAINLSFIHGILRRQYKLDLLCTLLYLAAPTVTAIIAIKGADSGLMLSLYLGTTTGLYITLVPICYGLFNSLGDWQKFLSWQVVIATPAAAWGIYQYFNGFNQIEWSYALSGLSRVHTLQMMMPEPRIFGLFGSASAMGCVGLYAAFAGWRTLRVKKFRYFFLAVFLIFMAAVILSHQRTVLILPLIILIFSYAFRRISTTVACYAAILTVFLVGIFNADYMVEKGLTDINDTIYTEGRWGQSVLQVGTFSDRLRGWSRLAKADSWSLFGTGKTIRTGFGKTATTQDYTAADYNHDIINKILINFGAVGLFVVLAFALVILSKLHNVVFKSKDWQFKIDSAFVMACITPVLILSFVGGDNFTTNPINLQIWSIFSGIFVLNKLLHPSHQLPSAQVSVPANQLPTSIRTNTPAFNRQP